jgi:ABC-type branched-subunit amino acid transport system permease subunit
VIGAVFLVIVLLSPGGLLGLWDGVRRRLVVRKPQPA